MKRFKLNRLVYINTPEYSDYGILIDYDRESQICIVFLDKIQCVEEKYVIPCDELFLALYEHSPKTRINK